MAFPALFLFLGTVITVESEKQGHRRGRGKRRRLGVSRGKGDYWTAAIEDKQVVDIN